MAENAFKAPSVGKRALLAIRATNSVWHMGERAGEFYKWGNVLENEEKRAEKFRVAAKMFGRILKRAEKDGWEGQSDYQIAGAYYVRALIMEAFSREKTGEGIKAEELYDNAALKAGELGWDEKNFYGHFFGASEHLMPTDIRAVDKLYLRMKISGEGRED